MQERVRERLSRMRDYLPTAKGTATRLESLRNLKVAIESHMHEIEAALWNDLHKSAHETYLTETSIVLHELKNNIRNLHRWSKPEKVRTPYFLLPSRSRIIKEPYGLVLVMSPWNYPFQLSIAPLIAAIAAGNSVVLKPSPDAPHTAKVIEKIVGQAFGEQHVALFHGDVEMNQALLQQRFDYIFFTGSPRIGKIVMQAASQNLTPVTLELGGKSPCVVNADADLDVAARRIAWGKYLNAGQTCVAPDYLLVHRSVKDMLLVKIKEYISTFYGNNPQQSHDYPRIINERSLDRLTTLLKGEKIYFGGQSDRSNLYLSPTIIDQVLPQSPIMQEEIFGPILPVLTYEKEEEAIDYINKHEKPLALYYFGKEKNGRKFIDQTSSGGACINDVILHLANSRLPFGGVGESGMGSYHGRNGFDTFSHRRSVLISRNWFDIPFKYPPYKRTELLKKIM